MIPILESPVARFDATVPNAAATPVPATADSTPRRDVRRGFSFPDM
ncbi:hypothetical protein Htur_3603 [Haloterrigena turkmenica DSM 5511]|uniref:Uncharacterized protein n=1 Tax=Haloterrigena turkmenica (strain ATCC 51198 / DSM 5511 / JCM 9101 / NCIMB 13204 / VKM B-1734 / 4k) TaxID=543526 RepID=D2RR69_HALTV|nr:hypothetical protein Htur_3603 [Haloterrigena turkmenica DSM 5511]